MMYILSFSIRFPFSFFVDAAKNEAICTNSGVTRDAQLLEMAKRMRGHKIQRKSDKLTDKIKTKNGMSIEGCKHHGVM